VALLLPRSANICYYISLKNLLFKSVFIFSMLNVSATISNLGSVEMLCNFGIFHLPCDKLHEKFHLSICTGGDCNMFRLFIIAIFREHWRTKDNLQLLIYKQYFLHNFFTDRLYLSTRYLPTYRPTYLPLL